MKKKIIVALIIFCIIFACCILIPAEANLIEENNENFVIEKTEEFFDEDIHTYDIEQLQNLIDENYIVQEHAHTIAQSARNLGWPENSETIEFAQNEWWNAELAITAYETKYQELYQEEILRWEQKKSEFPVATEIWLYMKGLGWNDHVCAGIMGNLMAECGGQTLDIKYWSQCGESYYGMCQWSKSAYKEIWGLGLQEQCDFLRDTIKNELDTFGYAYKKGFDYDSFLALTDERKVALAFAKCYERCNSKYYN